ncbi:hypothetical protein [Thermoactinospora rubra]|uniref:hypothetical protein n=1 Tax=Thermoactinospora rubra TaxID=1088767 RepID=UPI000A106D59|nr:hypothetical protein [Thermoactinospora rubra]
MDEDLSQDDLLEAELRRAAAVLDPVPAHLVRAAVEAFALRGLEAELAELTFDSLEEAAAVRSGYGTRLLTFAVAGRTVDVELSGGEWPGGEGVRLLGGVHPAEPAEVVVEGPLGSLAVRADELGRFSAEGVPLGPFSLRVRFSDAVVATEWITV